MGDREGKEEEVKDRITEKITWNGVNHSDSKGFLPEKE